MIAMAQHRAGARHHGQPTTGIDMLVQERLLPDPGDPPAREVVDPADRTTSR
jgi:hypothetical protein